MTRERRGGRSRKIEGFWFSKSWGGRQVKGDKEANKEKKENCQGHTVADGATK